MQAELLGKECPDIGTLSAPLCHWSVLAAEGAVRAPHIARSD